MAISRRWAVIASSVFLITIIAISLATTLEIRASPRRPTQITVAQAAKDESLDVQVKAGAGINGSAFDRADILSGTATIAPDQTGTYYLPATDLPSILTEEGIIGVEPTNAPSPTSIDEGMIGATPTVPNPTDEGFIDNPEASAEPVPIKPPPPPPPDSQQPILALTYAGDGGPKHCRGNLIQKLNLPHPAAQWKNGTCVDLPSNARCGIFYSGKGDNCEAQLFSMENCHNTTETYINTVVFMPEERPVGAIWRSMFIRCGVDAPEPAIIDPSILGGMLKKPKKPGGG